MSTSIAKLAAILQLDSKEFSSGIATAGRELDQFGAKANKTFATNDFGKFVDRKFKKHAFTEASQDLLFQMKGGGAGLGLNKFEDFQRDRATQKAFNRQKFGAIGGSLVNAKESMGMAAAGPAGIAMAGLAGALALGGLADPEGMKQFELALEGAGAALGTGFVPILKGATDVLRAITPLFQSLGEGIAWVLTKFNPGSTPGKADGFEVGMAELMKGRIHWKITPEMIAEYNKAKLAEEPLKGKGAPASFASVEDLARENWLAALKGSPEQTSTEILAATRDVATAVRQLEGKQARQAATNEALRGAPH